MIGNDVAFDASLKLIICERTLYEVGQIKV